MTVVKINSYKKRLNELGIHEGKQYTISDKCSFVILKRNHYRIGISKKLYNEIEFK